MVTEVIAESRLQRAWLVRRAFRLGSAWTIIERAVRGTSPLVRAARALARIGRGVLGSVAGAVRLDRRRTTDGLLDATEGVGMLAGLARFTLPEYGRDERGLVRVGRLGR